MAIFTVAIEGTIIATSMPSIVAQLGGFKFYAWVFSIFLLTQAVTTPIYGKLADMYGRKPVLIGGLCLFILGSLACGFASSMTVLIVWRFFQGFGAGAIYPISMTIVGDLYNMEERGRIQGYLSGVWGVSSIAGPLGGAVLVQYLGWSWVFWLAIPFGLAAILMLGLYLHEHLEHKTARVDFAGAGLLFVTLSTLVLALTLSRDLAPLEISALLILSGASFWTLLAHARRAANPIVNLELWSQPLIARANLAVLFAGVTMIGSVSFLPLLVQGVLGGSALVAGLVLAMMSLGWLISATAAGTAFTRTGAQKPARLGGAMLLAGSVAIALAGGYAAIAALGSFLVGVGMGLLNTSCLYSIQASVGWAERGAATASMVLMRTLGNALGAALFGGLLNFSLQNYLEKHPAEGLTLDSVRTLLSGQVVAVQSAATTAATREGLAGSLELVFWAMAVCALLCCAASWRVPELDMRKLQGGRRA